MSSLHCIGGADRTQIYSYVFRLGECLVTHYESPLNRAAGQEPVQQSRDAVQTNDPRRPPSSMSTGSTEHVRAPSPVKVESEAVRLVRNLRVGNQQEACHEPNARSR